MVPDLESRLPSALDQLKREGSAVLVTGEAVHAHAAACERFQGDETGERHRVSIRTGGSHRFSDGDDAAVVVTYDGDMQDLASSAVDAIDRLEGHAGGFQPAGLRVCIDSLDSLVDTHGVEAVFRFVHVTTGRIRRARGMGHFHLSAGASPETLAMLEPLFDAVLDVRDGACGVEQRWRLPDAELESGWLSL